MGRNDGRAPDALRPVRFTRRYLKHAAGSCLFEIGDTVVLCAATITESVAAWRRGSGQGWVTAEYSMLPAATHTRTKREVTAGRPTGRTHEIQRLIGRSLRGVVDLGGLGGEYTVNVDCDVLQADGGTRTAAITGAYVAFAVASNRLLKNGKVQRGIVTNEVAAISVGIVGNKPLLDLKYDEDSRAEVDMNVVCTGDGRFIEVQGTAERQPFTRDQMESLLALAERGIQSLMAIQREAIAKANS